MERPDNDSRTDPDRDPDGASELDAGGIREWLAGFGAALDGGVGSDVPCGDCTACCSSSQFVHVGPEEHDARAHIPRELLFPAPGLPAGHSLMGYDEHGRCPMLVEDRCTIYEHRPRTCRTYDCRVFPAAGLDPEDEGKPLIAARTRRWRFRVRSERERDELDAVRTAATWLADHSDELGPGEVPTRPTQLAVMAVEVHEVFLAAETVQSDEVRVALRRRGT